LQGFLILGSELRDLTCLHTYIDFLDRDLHSHIDFPDDDLKVVDFHGDCFLRGYGI
jgi:hypothetical protein